MSKITNAARGMSCIRCGRDDGTVCARHYNGYRQLALGKGRGEKCHDIASAELCAHCDQDFAEGVNVFADGERASKSIARSEEFLYYVTQTNIRRYERGLISAYEVMSDETLARVFHDTYERLAPSHGYTTREDTREFDPDSANGRLMIAVCGHVLRALKQPRLAAA